MNDSRHSKYLGLPFFIGRSKKQVFTTLKERVGQKLAGWKGKLLSMGGKEILIKVVAQAIPTYTMSCFQLPQGLCDDLEGMMRGFWWGQKHQEAKMVWVGWKQMCYLKSRGGGGFGLPEPAGLQPSYVGETSLENSYQSKLPYCSCSQGKIFSHR